MDLDLKTNKNNNNILNELIYDRKDKYKIYHLNNKFKNSAINYLANKYYNCPETCPQISFFNPELQDIIEWITPSIERSIEDKLGTICFDYSNKVIGVYTLVDYFKLKKNPIDRYTNLKKDSNLFKIKEYVNIMEDEVKKFKQYSPKKPYEIIFKCHFLCDNVSDSNKIKIKGLAENFVTISLTFHPLIKNNCRAILAEYNCYSINSVRFGMEFTNFRIIIKQDYENFKDINDTYPFKGITKWADEKLNIFGLKNSYITVTELNKPKSKF